MSSDVKKPRVLIVDDDRAMGEMLADSLQDRGYEGIAVASSADALGELRQQPFDALVTDLRMPGEDGLALITHSRELIPGLPVLVMTAYGAVDSAVELIRQGASFYLTKPFKIDELVLFLDRAIDERRVRHEASALRAALGREPGTSEVIAVSKAMRDVIDIIDRVAKSDVPILLLGETGTGKSLLARMLHAKSARVGGPFVTVNCAALPEPLLESELFGHVKGAFTGATRDRLGLVAESSSGTLFLDEIAEMSPMLQAKLLDVLERQVVRAVGASRERAVELRILSATHRDLTERIEAGAFREDLRYRLDVVSIEVPPLRRRRDDIPPLVDHFLQAARAKHPSARGERISPEAMALLLGYRWPGNVRELGHAVERMVLLAHGPDILPGDLPQTVLNAKPTPGMPFSGEVLPVRELTRRYAVWALEQCGGHRTRTAEKLDVDMKTLARWLNEAEALGSE